jgi:hypothetical protein
MLHFRPRAESGILKNMYFAAGPTLRHVREVSTVATITPPTGSDITDRTPAVPAKKNLIGVAAAVGFRWVDDVGINLSPEIRYTRWSGHTFFADSTQSPRDQFEVGLSFTF